MNGTSRLYRSTSERVLGGVAAGIGNYLKVDANIIRLLFLVLAFFSGGAFAAIYFALWLLLPTATSTAGNINGIIHENLDDMGSQFRGMTGMGNSGNAGNPGNSTATGTPTGQEVPGAQPTVGNQLTNPTPTQRVGSGPMALIIIGGFFLLVNLGFFHWVRWGMWWPLLLIGFGVLMLNKRRNFTP